ncbi:GT4_MtfB-like domain containing protein [Candidatus Methylopumilus planktonicus]|uniref:glycosyltransferase n=1 Tax=Candidatus Methylopumilus planktonicus TaxID=1581557 RepID=UPI003BEEED86
MDKNIKKIFVLSAINIVDGGPSKILYDSLHSLDKVLPRNWKIYALVHSPIKIKIKRIKFLAFPMSKKNWLIRLFFEYFYFYFLSKNIKPDFWFSLHDTTPNVGEVKQSVYFHNPSPFYKVSLKEAILEPKFFIFSKFYLLIYRLGIKKNKHVIVQQDWIKNILEKKLNIRNIIVAYPNTSYKDKIIKKNIINKFCDPKKITFFFPTFPRVFKNIEILIEAAKLLNQKGISSYEIIITINGLENLYSRYLAYIYRDIKNIKFIGFQKPSNIKNIYTHCDVVVFPSKLETWGLPISEAISFNKNILLANLPYAKESIGSYRKFTFFNPYSSKDLASKMALIIGKKITYSNNNFLYKDVISNWDDLWPIIITNLYEQK